MAHPSQIMGYLGQISSCACKNIALFSKIKLFLSETPVVASLTYLDVFEVKRLFTVFTVEGSLGAFTLIVTFLFVQSDELFTQGTGQNHELALAFVGQLQKTNTSFRRIQKFTYIFL